MSGSTARAVVLERRRLVYSDGADPAVDRPAHVRAASGVVAIGAELVVVQDDALWLARVVGPRVDALALPVGADGVRLFDDTRGNKAAKLDLEALLVLDGVGLVALGSGSTPRRERAVVVPWGEGPGTPRIVALPALYASLRAALPDVELNVEGCAVVGDRVRLLQRGNGAGGRDALLDVDLAWLRGALGGEDVGEPVVRACLDLHLGDVDGVRLTPTDVVAAGDRLWFTAAAEDSPDAVLDGVVVGAAVAWIDGGGAPVVAPLVGVDGTPLRDKVEGLAPGPCPQTLWLVTDADDPDAPAELLRVRVQEA